MISSFYKHYINPGLVSSVSGIALSTLYLGRTDSEYITTVFTDKEGAHEALRQAEAAVQDIMTFCKANGLI